MSLADGLRHAMSAHVAPLIVFASCLHTRIYFGAFLYCSSLFVIMFVVFFAFGGTSLDAGSDPVVLHTPPTEVPNM